MKRRAFLAGLFGVAATGASAQIIRPGMAPGFRPGFKFLGAAGADDPDVAAYIAALTTAPSSAERSRLNALVIGLKADGAWSPLDRLNVLAAETQQAGLRDLRNSAKTLIAGGTLTFTADRGFLGDGTTGYLDIGEIWNASGNQYALNSATVGVWCNLSGATGAKPQVGNLTGNARTALTARSPSGNETYQMNDTTFDVFMASNGSRVGHRTMSRTGANVKRGYFNGAKISDLTTVSTSINASNGCMLRANTTSFTDDRLAAFYSGAGLTDAQVAAIHSRLSTYLTAKGAN